MAKLDITVPVHLELSDKTKQLIRREVLHTLLDMLKDTELAARIEALLTETAEEKRA